MSDPNDKLGGASRLPDDRLQPGDSCRECGTPLGAGYLCDDCDEAEVAE